MTNKSARERLAECRKADRTCEVSDCYFPTQKWGRLCDSHDKTEERTGHPDGRTIRVAELQPFIGAAGGTSKRMPSIPPSPRSYGGSMT